MPRQCASVSTCCICLLHLPSPTVSLLPLHISVLFKKNQHCTKCKKQHAWLQSSGENTCSQCMGQKLSKLPSSFSQKILLFLQPLKQHNSALRKTFSQLHCQVAVCHWQDSSSKLPQSTPLETAALFRFRGGQSRDVCVAGDRSSTSAAGKRVEQ